ncbi:AraC family transcriptional regulator [Vibrio sp. HA2012]|uniref:AraC family transcriptional regulator n=1 Tax=Vibrio sp. HA2012 TaxID=1971595 RepID=UPI000C2C2CCF|nr:AraC family transcriptional regulator [Vibrio sp. HA2012]PJC87455.1 AraC family transcriptional regulator [Vibrio sp. HA2012]
MFKKSENMCKSVIDGFEPPKEWRDHVYLSDTCKERFLTLSDIPELEGDGFSVAGLSELSKGYRVERNGVDVHSLLFTVEGEGLLTTPFGQTTITPNSLTILPAESCFRFEIKDPSVEWKMVWMLLPPAEKWHEIAGMGQVVIPFFQCEQVWSLMVLLYSEINGRPGYRKLLISELLRLLTGMEAQPLNSTIRVQTLFNEVESQLHLPWTVKIMAEQCFLSEEQLNRISKTLFGCSPRARLIALRMEKAVDLLRYQDWSISMVATRLGYKDPYNFTHRFRKYYGCSPREYRKRLHF